MATTSPKLSIPFDLGSGSLMGQGTRPEPLVMYSTSDATTDPPVWTDATTAVRAFSVNRGRASELEEVDAGTASIVVDNATRTFDPIINTAIRPMNRWWIREQFTGETQDVFKGYAESYKPGWLSKRNTEAHVTVSCADEFKVLALGRLPVTSPPRDTYTDVVLFDAPSGYWQFPERDALTATVGPGLTMDVGFASAGSLVGGAAIVGEEIGGWLGPLGSGEVVATPAFDDGQEGQPGNACGLAEFTVEFWFMTGDATPAANRQLLIGQNVGGLRNWRFLLNTTGTVTLEAREDTGPTLRTITSTATLAADTWYHIVGTIDGGSVRLYINGTQEASTGFTGVVDTPHDAGERMSIAGEAENFEYDEVAFYPTGLSATRIAAHYTAGVSRGFDGGQVSGPRAGYILDAVTNHAPRRLDAGVRQMPGRFMRGQAPLEELRDCARAELSDGVLFISRAGEVVLLDSDHRSSSPYNTVQATFDDDGTDLPYQDFDPDYSEAFLINEWNLTGVGFGGSVPDASQLDTSSDATSIARYGNRPRSLQLPVISASELGLIGDALLAKYKDPTQRIQRIGFITATPDVTEAIMRRDIGDKIRVFRRPVGGGAAYDQSLFIQQIAMNGTPDGLWTVTWGVSPV